MSGIGDLMISLSAWIRIRNRLDTYFRAKALRPGRIRVTGERSVGSDVEDVTSSESAKRARRAAYFMIQKEIRQPASPEDVAIMRRSYEDTTSPTYVGHIVQSFDGRMVLELKSGVCESLHWYEGDRIGFRRLYSGELLTSVDRRARRNGNSSAE